MNSKLAVFAALLLIANTVQAVTFHSISSISSSTDADDFWKADNLIEGPGVGFDANEPHDKLGTSWVTAAPGGFPSDYIEYCIILG